MTSEGTQSAQRINRASLTPEPLLLHRVDASQLQAPVRVVTGLIEERPDYDDVGTPITRMELAGIVLAFVASWAIVGVLFYGATKLAEAML